MRVVRRVDELHIDADLFVRFWTLPSRMLATPSCFAISGRSAGELWYRCVDVREITFSSAIFASRVRISS